MTHAIRRYVFWLLDIIKGAKTLSHYNQIKKHMIYNFSNKKELEKILLYAKEETEFYKNIKGNQLENFPVMKKNNLQKNYEKIMCNNINEKLHWTCTSGSTGDPLKIPQNKNKRFRTKADLIFFHNLVGWKLGYKYVFIRSWVKMYHVSKLRIFAQNYIPIDVNSFTIEEKEKLRTLLKKDKKIKVIISYASAMEDFITYLEEKEDNYKMFKIKTVMTASDSLPNETKKRIQKMFNCQVVNRISNEEHGILGICLPNENTFTLNTASYYFEILEINSDKPVKIGELGRLVITDLYNQKFPLIRYDIGDLAIGLEKNEDGSYIKLKSFEGRSSELVYTDTGIPVTSVTLSTHLCTIKEIQKYQLMVYKNKMILKVVPNDFKKIKKDSIVKILKELFGDNKKVIVEIVEKIENEKNGKFKTLKIMEGD